MDPKAAEVAREYFAKSPHGHKIEQRLGVALDTIRSLEAPFDFVFIDADKINNAVYYERALELAVARRPDCHRQRAVGRPRPRPGRPTRTTPSPTSTAACKDDPRVKNVMVPIRDGVTIVRRA